MALKDNWTDLEDAIDGVPDSGSDITVEPINAIAHAVIDNEKAITDNKNRIAELEKNSGGDVDLSNYYTKQETQMLIDTQDHATTLWVSNELRILKEDADATYATKEEVGNIEDAITEIIALQNSYIGGDAS